MSKKVVICGIDTAKLPKLSHKDSVELLKKAKTDLSCRSQFICANLRLVLSIVARYNNRTDNLDDLFQAGCIGLVKSVDNFNCEMGVRFSTYAVPMIVGEIRRFLRENNSLRISRGIRDTAYMCLQARELLEAHYNKEVTLEMIALALDLELSRVVYCLNAIAEPISLQEKVCSDNENDGMLLIDQLCCDRHIDQSWTENITLSQALEKLSNREKSILQLRFYEGKTQTEVSRQVGISQAQVSRLEKVAVSRLRQYMYES